MSVGFEILLYLNFLALVFIFAALYKKKKIEDYPHYKFFIPAISIKLLGALAFTLIYQFYYKYGDTFLYFHDGIYLKSLLFENPSLYFEVLFQNSGIHNPETYSLLKNVYYSYDAEGFFMDKVSSIINIFSMNSFLMANSFASLFSFVGLWKLFALLSERYPRLKNVYAVAIFFIPSVFFWGSSLLKDTIALGCLTWLFCSLYNLVILKRKVFVNLFLTAILSWFVLKLKVYMLFVLYPSFLLMVYLHYKESIKNRLLRRIITPILLLGLVSVGFFGMNTLSKYSGKYSLELLDERIEGFHSWHTTLAKEEQQSGYDLGEVEYSVQGIIKKVPASLLVTFFRPFVWESNNVVMLAASLESTLLLIITLFVFFSTGPVKFFRYLMNREVVLFSMLFALMFGFAVGFTSYNFGALVRYKIPCIIFYIIGLFTLHYHARPEFYSGRKLIGIKPF